jgi:uncharacterized repeat protein (TIGR03803 family)
MKAIFPDLVMLCAGGCLFMGQLHAQTLTVLHYFTGGSDGTMGDQGAQAELVLSGNVLYGTANSTGSSGGFGTVFKVNADGTGFRTLHTFALSESSNPVGGVILDTNTFYGSLAYGGLGGGGIFAVNEDGSGFKMLHRFTDTFSDPPYTNIDGANPLGGLALASGRLHGTTVNGADFGNGAIFGINTDGTSFQNLHTFSAFDTPNSPTNTDGGHPYGKLLLLGNVLYGTTSGGGESGNGAIFSLNTDGTGFTNLHSFSGTDDGENLLTGLTLAGNVLYGTAFAGGTWGWGTIFAINTNGSGFRTLYHFKGSSNFGSDGAGPSGLICQGDILYGSTRSGGSQDFGTVFQIKTNGSGYRNLHSFTYGAGCGACPNWDGSLPAGTLVFSSDRVYGIASGGGSYGFGVLFQISLAPIPTLLAIASDGSGGYYIRAQGPPNFSCQLQRAASLTGPWTTTSSQTAPPSGLVEFHDLFPLASQAFYRTIQQ